VCAHASITFRTSNNVHRKLLDPAFSKSTFTLAPAAPA
jgi:hypothetical protein